MCVLQSFAGAGTFYVCVGLWRALPFFISWGRGKGEGEGEGRKERRGKGPGVSPKNFGSPKAFLGVGEGAKKKPPPFSWIPVRGGLFGYYPLLCLKNPVFGRGGGGNVFFKKGRE